MQLKHEILNKLTAYSESLLDSHGHYVQCVIEDDWSTLADEILTLLQTNDAVRPNDSKPIVSGSLPSKCIAPLGGRFGCDFPDDSCEKCRVGNDC